MKILHINISDKIGGAAIAALRLHEAMLSQGIDSKYLVLKRAISDREDIKAVSLYQYYIKRVFNLILEKIITKNINKTKGMFSSFKYGIDISGNYDVIEADIIYLHWICGSFISYKGLRKILRTEKPVFWFMHDMFPITGGCHYAFTCRNYETKCNKCLYHNRFFLNLSRSQFKIKQKLYKQFDNLMFISPSKWLFDCAKKSELTKEKRIYHIPNLINPEVFQSMDKNTARRLLSIDTDKKIIGFGLYGTLKNPYKGWDSLKEALYILSNDASIIDKQIELLVFGSSYNKEIANNLPFVSHFLGILHDEYSLIMMYNCMDVLVMPSLAENFPNTILESLACNTPVIGFNTGGISEMVNTNTGYLAKYGNSIDLAKGISSLLKEGKDNVNNFINPFLSNTILEEHKKLWIND